MAEASEDSAQHFATNSLPLYHGPLVKIRVTPSNDEFTISKDLLCASSPVFSAMFEGPFRDFHEMMAGLEEMEYVISHRGPPGEHITAAMELVRLADKYDIVGLETEMGEYIREIIVANPHPMGTISASRRDTNTYWIVHEHIISASYLRHGHPVRQILAKASVSGHLLSHDHKFFLASQEYPPFAADLLEVRMTLDRPSSKPAGTFEDPITREMVDLEREKI
ncbi:hypothetical protein N7478_008625 [Penicillium angulare]|uniref:uncharacterized protein n=1 Tax=Penicillium angulare TaxID=116970 RepID=UPI00253FEE76|nr:uncharacterized protein N7478_008625 [Penicillium angulare]KAJ5273500.1 hypothetical protein N7478_008625 [Penicillium angulare]